MKTHQFSAAMNHAGHADLERYGGLPSSNAGSVFLRPASRRDDAKPNWADVGGVGEQSGFFL